MLLYIVDSDEEEKYGHMRRFLMVCLGNWCPKFYFYFPRECEEFVSMGGSLSMMTMLWCFCKWDGVTFNVLPYVLVLKIKSFYAKSSRIRNKK